MKLMPFGYSEDDLLKVISRGIKYDKRTRRKLVEAFKQKPGTSEENIESLEKSVGVKLPNDYRRFLTEQNGGRCRECTVKLPTGERVVLICFLAEETPLDTESIDFVRTTISDRLPGDLIPIAREPFGNFFVLDLNKNMFGHILFWDHELSPEHESPSREACLHVTESFTDFLSSIEQKSDLGERES
jgi:cell wall assembly regulator SMI1